MCIPGREAKTIKDMGKHTHMVNKPSTLTHWNALTHWDIDFVPKPSELSPAYIDRYLTETATNLDLQKLSSVKCMCSRTLSNGVSFERLYFWLYTYVKHLLFIIIE